MKNWGLVFHFINQQKIFLQPLKGGEQCMAKGQSVVYISVVDELKQSFISSLLILRKESTAQHVLC